MTWLGDRFFSQTTAIALGKHYEPPLRVDWSDEFLCNTTLKEFIGDRCFKTPNPYLQGILRPTCGAYHLKVFSPDVENRGMARRSMERIKSIHRNVLRMKLIAEMGSDYRYIELVKTSFY